MIGPHRGVQPVDVRECAHVVAFGREYTHETYPSRRIVGAQNILEFERVSEPYTKHLEESMREF